MTTAIGSTPLRPPRRTAVGAHVPALLEWFAVVAAIALLWPAFERIADGAGGRDRRFPETAFAIQGLPDEVLPGACAALGGFADVTVQERLCGRSAGRVGGTLPARLPLEFTRASAQAARAIAAPMRAAEIRLEALRERQRDGSDDGEQFEQRRHMRTDRRPSSGEKWRGADRNRHVGSPDGRRWALARSADQSGESGRDVRAVMTGGTRIRSPTRSGGGAS